MWHKRNPEKGSDSDESDEDSSNEENSSDQIATIIKIILL